MIAIFEQVLILLIFCCVGYLLSKTKMVNPEHSKTLSVLLVYVFAPCLSFRTFMTQFNVAYLRDNGFLVLVSLGLLPVIILVANLLVRFLGKDRDERAVNEYSMTFGNIGYMGYPLAGAVYGEAVMMNCMMFALPMTIYINTVSFNILTAGKEKKPLWKRIFTPGFIGILLGCVVGILQIPLPEVVSDITKMSGNCMAPTSMLLTGMAISQFSMKELLLNKKAYLVCAVRLVLAPLLAFGLLKLAGLEFAITAAVILYAMPCGMNTIVFPKLVGKDCRLGASTVMISTVLSMLTIPLLLNFLL